MSGSMFWSSSRRHIIGCGIAMAGWVAFNAGVNTIGVKMCSDFIKKSAPYCKDVSSDPDAESLLNQTIADINKHQSKPVKRHNIEFLQSNFLQPREVVHKGHAATKALIGFPIGTRCDADEVFHYHCTANDSVDQAEFCILSPEGKKFIFARQIYYIQDNYNLGRCILGLALISVGSYAFYLVNATLEELAKLRIARFKIQNKTRTLPEGLVGAIYYYVKLNRWLAAVLLSVLLTLAYKVGTASYSYKLEQSADKKVADLGRDYIKGGMEYYQKVITANKYENRLLGDSVGFDSNGERTRKKYQFQKSVPYSQRLTYFIALDQIECGKYEES